MSVSWCTVRKVWKFFSAAHPDLSPLLHALTGQLLYQLILLFPESICSHVPEKKSEIKLLFLFTTVVAVLYFTMVFFLHKQMNINTIVFAFIIPAGIPWLCVLKWEEHQVFHLGLNISCWYYCKYLSAPWHVL